MEATVRDLLDRGADIDVQGGEYRSALWAALTPNERGHTRKPSAEVSKVLWDAGARFYTMPSEAHSEEYIDRLQDMDSKTIGENTDALEPHSSKRRSWS